MTNEKNEIQYLTCEDFKNMVNELTIFFEEDEPIPPFNTCNISLLESCINSIRQTAFGEDVFPTIEEKAAKLFYGIIKNHPFQNGNKRIAVYALILFLSINIVDFHLIDEKSDLYENEEDLLFNLAIHIANSEGLDFISEYQYIHERLEVLLNNDMAQEIYDPNPFTP